MLRIVRYERLYDLVQHTLRLQEADGLLRLEDETAENGAQLGDVVSGVAVGREHLFEEVSGDSKFETLRVYLGRDELSGVLV